MNGSNSRGVLRIASIISVAATAFTGAAPAIAQGERLTIEEVVVTARKREESVQDVPISMTALTQQLQDSSVRNLADLNGYTANVNIGETTLRARGTNIQIRGVAASETQDKSHDSPIAVSIDGVFLGTSTGRNVENFDLERIEILRGPQGTLFGKNTVGGVINIIRSKPTGEFGGKVKLTGGRYGQQEFRGLVNFPITDTLAAKVFYTDIQADGHLKKTGGGDGPKKDYQNYGISLRWNPTEQFEALLTAERYEDNSDLGASVSWNFGPGVLAPPSAGSIGLQDNSGGFLTCTIFGDCRTSLSQADSFSASDQEGEYENDVITLNLTYDITENLRFVSVTGNHDTPKDDYISDLDASALDFISIDNDNTYEQFTQELRLEGSSDNVDWVIGAYYLDASYEQDWVTGGFFWGVAAAALDLVNNGFNADLCRAGVFAPLVCDTGSTPGQGLGPNFVQKLYQEQDTTSKAIFAQADYRVTDKLTLTAGVRYTDEEKDFVGYQSYLAPLARERVFNFPASTNLKNDWQETSIKLAASYAYSDDIMFYGSYSEGFKSGGFFGRNQNISDFANNQYDPEYAESFEIGMKSQWFENRLQLNVAAFTNDFEDKQDSNIVLDPSTNTVATVWENIGSLVYKGLEAEVQYLANENLELFFTAGYLDAEYDEFLSSRFVPVTQRATTPPQDVSFLTPKLAPETTFGFGGTYSVQVGPGELNIHAKWNFIDEQETQTYNDPGTDVDSQTFVNAVVTYQWDRFIISAFGNNLTDETLEIPFTGVAPFFANSSVTVGRTYGLEVEMAF